MSKVFNIKINSVLALSDANANVLLKISSANTSYQLPLATQIGKRVEFKNSTAKEIRLSKLAMLHLYVGDAFIGCSSIDSEALFKHQDVEIEGYTISLLLWPALDLRRSPSRTSSSLSPSNFFAMAAGDLPYYVYAESAESVKAEKPNNNLMLSRSTCSQNSVLSSLQSSSSLSSFFDSESSTLTTEDISVHDRLIAMEFRITQFDSRVHRFAKSVDACRDLKNNTDKNIIS